MRSLDGIIMGYLGAYMAGRLYGGYMVTFCVPNFVARLHFLCDLDPPISSLFRIKPALDGAKTKENIPFTTRNHFIINNYYY